MCTEYWSQWSHAEIMSMHGVELDDEVDTDLLKNDDEADDTNVVEQEHCCGNCMDDLGLSWRDFM